MSGLNRCHNGVCGRERERAGGARVCSRGNRGGRQRGGGSSHVSSGPDHGAQTAAAEDLRYFTFRYHVNLDSLRSVLGNVQAVRICDDLQHGRQQKFIV